MRSQSQKILSVILAAMTSMSPVMTYAAETEEIQSDIVETVTQQETTKKLNIDMNSGGVVILNPGFESEEKIKVSEKEDLKEFRIYDKDDVLIDVKDFEYTYETDVNSVININVSAEDGYGLEEFSINGENVGFSVSQSEYSYAALIDGDKELKVSFKEKSKKENDVQDNTVTQITADGDLTVNSQKEAEKEEQKDDLTVNDTLKSADEHYTSNDNIEDVKPETSLDEDIRIVDNEKTDKTESVSEDMPETVEDCEDTDSDLLVLNDNSDESAIDEQSDDTNLCYVLAYDINKVIDGTAPFDSDDTAGNDSSNENGIVRSFDTINYTLKYTTAIKDAETQGIDSTNVMIDFLLPCSPVKAEFNTDTMTWLLDKQVTYTYEDGSTSTSYDMNKNVVSQRLTGRRLLVNSEAGNTVPGTGTLAIGVNVNAAVTGDVINPEFTIWMEGNSEDEKKTLTASTVVSAAPKYDIVIRRNASANLLGYYNLDDRTARTDKEKETDKYGRLQTYAIGLAVQNDSSQKGMKGVEYPDGNDITFDLRMSEVVNGQDVSNQESYKPLFWDYKMSNGYSDTGKLGRLMAPFGQSIAAYGNWTTNTPENNGNYNGGCYNGGNMNITVDENDENLLHVTLSGYKMDLKDFDFPNRYSGASYQSIPDNTGYFSIGIMQMIARFKTNVEVIENVGVTLEASNIHARSMSGIDVTSEVTTSNNTSSVQLTNYPEGSHSKRNFYYTATGGQLRRTTWDAGDSYAYIGEQIQVEGHMVYTGDGYLTATNILQKIDDDAFTIPENTDRYLSYGFSNGLSSLGSINTLFAAKPDKTGWIDDNEMNNTQEEQLIYFKNINDLTNAGYKCVGMLYEVRNSKLYPNNSGGCIAISQMLNIRPDVKIGSVYMTKNNVRSWREGTDYSYSNVIYDSSIKAYGIGDKNWTNGTYANGYTQPTYRADTNYGKAVYKDGTMVSGHTNGYMGGNSVLIIGNRTGIAIEVADRTEDKAKTVYDLDAGERTVKFKVQPSTIITSANSEVQESGAKDNLKIMVTLPKGLHFNTNGVSMQPESVTENADGITLIVWKMNDVKVGAGLDAITFSTTIGEEGTANDVRHNDAFTIIAKITSDNDTRKVTAANGNYAETGMSVIKLAASAVTKRVLTPLVERLQDIKFRLRYSNLSDTEAINAKIYDILPYNDDGRGSAFSGSYNLKSMVIDFSNAKKTYQNGKNNIACYVSSTERNKNTMDNLVVTGTGLNTFTKMSGAVLDDANYKISWNNISAADAASAYAYLGYVFGHEYIDIYLTLTPKDTVTRQQPGDIYGNNFVQYADNQASNVTSNVVKAQVVKRDLSGVAWLDDNANGIREDGEKLLKGVTVTLYRTKESKYVPAGSSAVLCIGDNRVVYPSLDVFVKPVRSTTTDENGYYHFDNLEDGPYLVEFDNIDKYYLTATDAGNDDAIDSDAVLENTHYILIPDISLPEIANMTEWSFSSPHHDIGLIRKTKVEISKIGTVTKELLGCAELEIYNAADIEDGKPKDGASPVVKWTTEQGKKKTIENVLLAGKQYVLIEVKAPVDYAIADPITFTVNADSGEQQITMSDDYDTHPVSIRKKNLNDQLIGDAVLQITGKEDGKADNMEPVQWTSEENKEHVVELRKGAYTLHEITPPAGYLPAEDIRFTVDKDGNIFIAGNKTDAVEMTDIQVKSCKVTIKKYESDGKTPLAGVTFKLEFLSAKYPDVSGNKNYSRLLKPGESKELTSDSNGEIVFENLDQGEYVLSEIKTASGHMLMKDSIHISLPLEMTDEEVKQAGNIDMTKAEKFGGLNHFYELKYDISNGAVLDMPKTGDNGFWKFGILGFGLMAAAFSVMTKRKKKK